MRVIKGKCHISVEQIEGFGKNPGLWVGRNNAQVKVASFGNPDKAEAFWKWLMYIVGNEDDDTDLVKWFLDGMENK